MSAKDDIKEVIARIPAGKVVSYGQVADLVGVRAQIVGWILSGFTVEECEQHPWQRVVNKAGFISTLKLGYKGSMQIELLEKEGVAIIDEHVDMQKFQHFFEPDEGDQTEFLDL